MNLTFSHLARNVLALCICAATLGGNLSPVHAASPTPPEPAAPTVICPPIAAWKGEYWNWSTPYIDPITTVPPTPSTLCRDDASPYFDWGTGGPGGGVNNDDFFVRWTRVVPFEAGIYRFHARADDGVRLWIDGVLILNQWFDHPVQEFTVDRALAAGNHLIRIDYYENGGGAIFQFWYNQTYAFCANENQLCAFFGVREVAYGAQNSFSYLPAAGSISCSTTTFGDPLPGVAKACYTKNNSYNRLMVRHSSLCMTVLAASPADNAKAIQSSCGTGANQAWNVKPAGGGYYMLIAYHSGKCLTAANGSIGGVPNFVQLSCAGINSQLFKPEASGGYYNLRVKHNGLCVRVAGGSMTNGAELVQAVCSPENSQLWWPLASGYVAPEGPVGLSPEVENEQALVPTGAYEVVLIDYTVEKGDSLALMSAVYGIDVDKILQANPELSGPEAVQPGLVLRLPVRVPVLAETAPTSADPLLLETSSK